MLHIDNIIKSLKSPMWEIQYTDKKLDAIKDAWKQLKETIIELRDNDGTGTQQEICKFLANYMNVLERGMNNETN